MSPRHPTEEELLSLEGVSFSIRFLGGEISYFDHSTVGNLESFFFFGLRMFKRIDNMRSNSHLLTHLNL